MKIKVVPAHKIGGQMCYIFVERAHAEAYKRLTGQKAVSQPKLDALAAFGIRVSVTGESSKQTDATQESN